MPDIEPKIYPAEFKESAIRLAIESKQPFAQTARELGITKYSRSHLHFTDVDIKRLYVQ
ncbi:hypothetical protein [Rickettsia endosymbiont of Cantharis rufa]|uniref:hypothetical protein n=1 Tax=Rickettsia endosymbiont of Cantharis rufa TaxID=3066248 RepID=UPI003133408D